MQIFLKEGGIPLKVLQVANVIYFKQNACKFGTPYGESKITSEVNWMPLKICHENERRCLFACLVQKLLKTQPYRDMQTKHFCFDSHRALKTGLKKEDKSLIQRVVMAIGHILGRGLVGLLWLLWCVFLKCFYKLHQFKQRFHVDPQGNLNKTVSIIP